MVKVVALIVGAGRGARFSKDQATDRPKQYYDLAGRMILRHSLATFAAHPLISHVKTVIHKDDLMLYEEAAKGLFMLPPAFGGKTRQESVCLGLESLEEYAPDVVLIHDAARPFVSADLITEIALRVTNKNGAIPAIPIVDTIKGAKGGLIMRTVDRNGLYTVQTPQGFPFPALLRAHKKLAGQDFSDDALLAEHEELDVFITPGEKDNMKITHPEDIRHATSISHGRIRHTKTGSGFDVHAFKDGESVTLGGVKIPHEKALSGHSDADVVLHALTDAILGAIGAGDIGHYFPPSDMRWKGAPSDLFLQHANELLKALGGHIVNVDLTVICESPKISPVRFDMMRAIAQFLGIRTSAVNVKGKTTEKLGFTGRDEGIAAMATATVVL